MLGGQRHRVLVGFASGGVVAAAGLVIVSVLLDTIRTSAGQPFSTVGRWLSLPVSMALGGAVAGRSLCAGARGVMGMATGFLVAGLVQQALIGDLLPLTGREPPVLVVAVLAGAGMVSYGVAGGAAALVLRQTRSEIAMLMAGFAAAGLAAGVVPLVQFLAARVGLSAASGDWGSLLLVAGQVVAFVVPFVVAGLATVTVTGTAERRFHNRHGAGLQSL